MDNPIKKPNKAICFECNEDYDIEYFGDSLEDLNDFEKHLLKVHHILKPKFTDYDHLLQSGDLKDFETNDMFSKLVMNRFEKRVVYYIIEKDKIDTNDEKIIKKIIEKDFLENILTDAQNERNCRNFNRTCLFCKKIFNENRAQLFDHLYHDHNLFLGHPDNIINSNEFFDLLENKLKILQCLYCEKNFKSWNVLKEHMRKKGHKLLNPDNREYDRFYLINYLCSDKHWQQIKKENDFYIDNYNDDWCDWVDDDKQDCLCFFCPYKNKFVKVKQHLLECNQFDFNAIISLDDFYDRIRIVNFIRKQLLSSKCFICDTKFGDFRQLMEHMSSSGHISQLPTRDLYNHPEYYFSTLEDDGFLFFLDDFKDGD